MKIIRNGELVLPNEIINGDIMINNEIITHIGHIHDIPVGAEIIDATGCYVFPGFIDPHTHFQMTNVLASTADDFESGSLAAIAGGTTTVINFATPEEGSLIKGLQVHRRRADNHISCDVAFHMEIVDVNDTILAEIPRIVNHGVSSFKVYLAYGFRLNDKDLYRVIRAISPTGALVAAHCENGPLIEALIDELRQASKLGVGSPAISRPILIGAEAIHRFVTIGALADYPVHIVHVSSELGLNIIEQERRKGHHVTCETCPQYLVLNESLYTLPDFEGAKYVMSPPLRCKQDNVALQNGLMSDMVQTVGSDHCSFNFESQKKQGLHDFTRIPGGVPGVEERGLITYHVIVNERHGSPHTFMKVISENSAKLYGLYPKKGALQVGSDADITILNPHIEQVLSKRTAHTKADYIPYEGMKIKGGIAHVFLRGHHIVDNGEIINDHLGKCIP